jgi:phosphoribosyl-AMP cyclohydrolase
VYYSSTNQVLWQAGITGGQYVVIQNDGTLQVLGADGTTIVWSVSGTPGSSLQIVNGQAALVNGGSIVWGSTTGSVATSTSLVAGQTLVYGSRITGSDGSYLTLDQYGNLVYYSNTNQVLWQAGITGGQYVVIQNDGTLQVLGADGTTIVWSVSGTPGSSLQIVNGQAALVNGGSIVWGSTTGSVATSTSLVAGQTLVSGSRITGSDGSYLTLDQSGNLVYYSSTNQVLWQAGITGGQYVVIQSDGTLQVLGADQQTVVWSLNGTPGSILQIGTGRVEYVNGGSIIWDSINQYAVTPVPTDREFYQSDMLLLILN